MAQRTDHQNGGANFSLVARDIIDSAVLIGNNNNVRTRVTPPSRPNDDEAVEALRQIRALLETLSGPHAAAARADADTATTSAVAPVPDKSAIGSAMDDVLRGAQKTLEFASIAEKFTPYVETVGAWLGSHGVPLLAKLAAMAP